MDKLTREMSAQDMIKANTQAEVESAISESVEAVSKKMEENFNKKFDENSTKTHDVGVQTYRNIQAILNKQEEKHQEEYKEIQKKFEEVHFAIETKNSALLPLLIVTLLVAGADLVINILRIFGII
jgi:DNA anti-recombination protein RmuC